MDGGGAAALDHADKEAEAEVEDGEDMAMGVGGVVCMWGVVVLVRVAMSVRPWGLYLWVAL